MDEIERVATVLGTLASGTVWVIGLAMLALMAAQPLLEAFAQSRVDGDVRAGVADGAGPRPVSQLRGSSTNTGIVRSVFCW